MTDRATSTDLDRPRVLVVDDDEPLLRVHARALTNAGFIAETALDGQAAMRANLSAIPR